jgi:acetyl-CoA acetyltransferase
MTCVSKSRDGGSARRIGAHRRRDGAPTTVEGLAGLRPAFKDEGYAQRFCEIEWSIMPGNSSPLTDGASAALIMSEEKAAALGLRPRAHFHTFSVSGSDPLRCWPASSRRPTRRSSALD